MTINEDPWAEIDQALGRAERPLNESAEDRWFDAMYGSARPELVEALKRTGIHPNVAENLVVAVDRRSDIEAELTLFSRLTPTQTREARRLLGDYEAARDFKPLPSSSGRAAPAVMSEADVAQDAQLLAQVRSALSRVIGRAAEESSARTRLDQIIGRALREGRPWSAIPDAVAEECRYLDTLTAPKGGKR